MMVSRRTRTLRTISFLIAVCLIAFPAQAKYSGGSGTADDPYQIATAADLIALGETPNDYDKHFLLTADIDLDPKLPGRKVFDKAVIASPETVDALGNFRGTPFTGVFDGNGHTISHLPITGGWYLGLFGYLGYASEAKNLGVVDVNITGSGERVGGLAGYSYGGDVTYCYSSGTVSGKEHVGGMVGYNAGSVTHCNTSGTVSGSGSVGGLVGYNVYGPVTHCYSTGAVGGEDYVGGLVGWNWNGVVIQCYSTGAVSGGRCVGGLVGGTYIFLGDLSRLSQAARITECYSTGSVKGDTDVGGLVGGGSPERISGCFWDVRTSAQNKSVGGTGKTTAEMQTASTFLEARWDFVGEATNGAEDIWWINEGQGYPRLAWEFWAFSPYPNDSATDVVRSPVLSWYGAQGAAAHEVYFGDNEGGVADATSETQGIHRGRQAAEITVYDPGILDWGKTYYWRIDEVNPDDPDAPWKGRVWRFRTTDCVRSPHPVDGAVEVTDSPILSWVPGGPGLYYDVYFAEDEHTVANATPQSLGVYCGRQAPGVTSYDPGALEWAQTYYWRIDGIDEADPSGPCRGDVWRFTTLDWVVGVVDDFESYTYGAPIYQTWMDGWATNSSGSFVHVLPERYIVHTGRQSMPMDYNNVKKPWYSEAERSWATPQDWTINGADTLTLYFRGKADNGRDRLYVRIEDSGGRIAVVVHPDAAAVLATEWQKWHIPLGEVQAAGVNVAAVKKMVIGVGDRKNPRIGGTGTIYIDDIRLTKRMP